MANQFGGTLYRTHAAMLRAIAYEWASAGGNEALLAESFATETDQELAADCVASWELDRGDAYDELPSHMEREGYSLADLIVAFGELRRGGGA